MSQAFFLILKERQVFERKTFACLAQMCPRKKSSAGRAPLGHASVCHVMYSKVKGGVSGRCDVASLSADVRCVLDAAARLLVEVELLRSTRSS